MEKVFESPDEFSAFLEQNPALTSTFPWLNEIINLTKNINVGCGCQKSRRTSIRNESYKNMIITIIGGNQFCADHIRNYLQASKVVFKLNNEIIREI